jgi:hypothetical protein
VEANLRVRAQAIPNKTVRVSEGLFWLNETQIIEFQGGNSAKISFPTVQARWVIVTLGRNGNINLVHGAQSPDPQIPLIPQERLPLAGIFIQGADSVVTEDMVFDLRPFLRSGAKVSGLTIADIDGLQAALDEKADITGTPSATFTLNNDHTGPPTEDVLLRVERGDEPDVFLRWNETDDVWELTNDGTTIDQIVVSPIDGGIF